MPLSFIELPTELRLQIYALAYEGAEVNVTLEPYMPRAPASHVGPWSAFPRPSMSPRLNLKPYEPHGWARLDPRSIGLASANQFIWNECFPVLLETAVFVFPTLVSFIDILSSWPAQDRAALRHVRVTDTPLRVYYPTDAMHGPPEGIRFDVLTPRPDDDYYELRDISLVAALAIFPELALDTLVVVDAFPTLKPETASYMESVHIQRMAAVMVQLMCTSCWKAIAIVLGQELEWYVLDRVLLMVLRIFPVEIPDLKRTVDVEFVVRETGHRHVWISTLIGGWHHRIHTLLQQCRFRADREFLARARDLLPGGEAELVINMRRNASAPPIGSLRYAGIWDASAPLDPMGLTCGMWRDLRRRGFLYYDGRRGAGVWFYGSQCSLGRRTSVSEAPRELWLARRTGLMIRNPTRSRMFFEFYPRG